MLKTGNICAWFWAVVSVVGCTVLASRKGSYRTNDTAIALEFLNGLNTKGSKVGALEARASWDYFTDMTPEKRNLSVLVSTLSKKFSLEASRNASSLLRDHVDLPQDLARQIRLIRYSAVPRSQHDIEYIEKLITKMTTSYSSGKVCKKQPYGQGACLELDPDLTSWMAKSRDYDELLWAWQGWRDSVGPPIRAQFRQLVIYLNSGAREHGWGDYGHYMRSEYEIGNDFKKMLEELWTAVKPLYKELHAYVRHKLLKRYPKVSPDGPIEAHLLGNMWAQDWSDIYDLVVPFPNVSTLDVTPNLLKQKYTPKRMFELAQSFFVSMGLYPMPKSFWEKSVLSKPENRSIVCHASALGLEADDVRIKMCTRVNQNDLIISHHEMGHCEYFLAYRDLPYAYRSGANPGFHEAIGDTIALSVETPKYLHSVGLLYSLNTTDETTINFLLMQALRRVAPLPFTFLVDQWRWQVFAGNIQPSDYNKEWWKMRLEYQGVAPPVTRTENDFDPGAKFHIASNSAYIGYFVSLMLQFQFHRSLCGLAQHKGPLHECSIYKCKEAGEKFKEMLRAGRSKHWKQILFHLTGEREMTASALIQYFDPLKKWLFAYRKIHGYKLGWKTAKKPMKAYNSKGVKKTTLSTGSHDNYKLPDLRTALKEMQPDRNTNKKKDSPSISAKSSIIEAAKPMFLPNKVKDQLNLG